MRTTSSLRLLLTVLGLGIAVDAFPGEAAHYEASLGILPKPAKISPAPGLFRFTAQTRIGYQPTFSGGQTTAEYLARLLSKSFGFPFPVEAVDEKLDNSILLTSAGPHASLGDEGYRLEVTPKDVVLRAGNSAGLFYGIQTLRQLLPPEAVGPARIPRSDNCVIPCLEIEDAPRLCWRGMHLDVSRHFFGVDFVKRFIDLLAVHKMNVFHWHLSDDDGWRVEIKKYPRLTEVGAWRGPKEALPPSYGSGDQRYGGFYTQDQIRDVIHYAAERHVLIVPEVDVPAHSRAATVAYPELLCAGDPYQFKSVQDVPANVLCPSQERTYEFLEGVFGELAELFPGPYLHVGGDERPKGPWEQCERCQKRMKNEQLPNGSYLQDRFLKRLQGILRAHGKKMIGWDELEQESVLDKDYTVMAWNRIKAGLTAAGKGYPVIMTPSPFTYLDLSYNEDPAEPGLRWAGVVSLEKTYSLDPKPANLDPTVASHIIGVHGCLWSETLVTPDRPDYMLFPRMCALAEVGWTPQSERSWPEFRDRLYTYHLARLDAAGVSYRIPPPEIRLNGKQVELAAPYAGAELHYTLDGAEPGPASPLYRQPLTMRNGAVLKACTIRPNGRSSRTVKGPPDVQPGK